MQSVENSTSIHQSLVSTSTATTSISAASLVSAVVATKVSIELNLLGSVLIVFVGNENSAEILRCRRENNVVEATGRDQCGVIAVGGSASLLVGMGFIPM